MAQDLEKIFPKAVFKGDDGFLRIRMEDMFYALVNAVKELDKNSAFHNSGNNDDDVIVPPQVLDSDLESKIQELESKKNENN